MHLTSPQRPLTMLLYYLRSRYQEVENLLTGQSSVRAKPPKNNVQWHLGQRWQCTDNLMATILAHIYICAGYIQCMSKTYCCGGAAMHQIMHPSSLVGIAPPPPPTWYSHAQEAASSSMLHILLARGCTNMTNKLLAKGMVDLPSASPPPPAWLSLPGLCTSHTCGSCNNRQPFSASSYI